MCLKKFKLSDILSHIYIYIYIYTHPPGPPSAANTATTLNLVDRNNYYLPLDLHSKSD